MERAMNIPTFTKVSYGKLTAKQQENYNFHFAAAVLAQYGYNSIRLTDDWNGADFIAVNNDGHYLKVQLKGRLYISKRYAGKDLWIAFVDHANNAIYLYPHDAMMDTLLQNTNVAQTESWSGEQGAYGWKHLSQEIRTLIKPDMLSL